MTGQCRELLRSSDQPLPQSQLTSVRATIHEVFQLKALNRTPDAIALARKQIARHLEDSRSGSVACH